MDAEHSSKELNPNPRKRDMALVIIAILVIFFSGAIAGADWWLVAVAAVIMGLVAFFSMLG